MRGQGNQNLNVTQLKLKYFDAEDLGLASFHSGPKIHSLYYKGIQISSIDSNEYFICFVNVRGSQKLNVLFAFHLYVAR